MKSKKKVSQKVSRSAVTGKFVSTKFAKKHPKTTFKDTVKVKR